NQWSRSRAAAWPQAAPHAALADRRERLRSRRGMETQPPLVWRPKLEPAGRSGPARRSKHQIPRYPADTPGRPTRETMRSPRAWHDRKRVSVRGARGTSDRMDCARIRPGSTTRHADPGSAPPRSGLSAVAGRVPDSAEARAAGSRLTEIAA